VETKQALLQNLMGRQETSSGRFMILARSLKAMTSFHARAQA
jgi:hypothetical protein